MAATKKPTAVRPSPRGAVNVVMALALGLGGGVIAEENAASDSAPDAAPPQRIYIREYRVIGAKVFPKVQVEEAVYPFLGPGRTTVDVESARVALEKAYHDAGYQAASVQVPEQSARGGTIFLMVGEGTVGRLRVKGARFFLPSHIKARARSLAEGRAVNFNDVQRDIVALNQLADRQVTPSLSAGEEPGTIDVELTVRDKFPLHGSVELNNRYSANTTPLRLTLSASYANLWQAGHTIGATYQVAPARREDTEIFAGYYIARFPWWESFSLMLEGRKQTSDIAAGIGGFSVASPGESVGLRGIWALPTGKNFYHSANVGLAYNHYKQVTGIELGGFDVTYFPLSVNYSATWAPTGSVTELNAGLTLGFRGAAGRSEEFENIRFEADANFLALRGDLSHTHDLPWKFEAFAKVQGQLASRPLIPAEQFAAGGLTTVRGYLEAAALGDNGIAATVELRSPSLLDWLPKTWKGNEWRIYVFGDAAFLHLQDALPEQESGFQLASFGVGSRVQLLDHVNGSIDLAVPIFDGTTTGPDETRAGEPFLSFRVSADF